MNSLYIIKTGTSFTEIVRQHGDFDAWVAGGLALDRVGTVVVDVRRGDFLPEPSRCAGVVVTGSHHMVTDRLPWSTRIEQWIPPVLAAGVPFLGICYGHQLLAQAMGGTVGYHPFGIEAGTVGVDLSPAGKEDPLFFALPQHFNAHAIHSQTVFRLPAGAVGLAANAHEPNHAFRLGSCAWGVQFHPEYDVSLMRAYLHGCADDLAAAGRDLPALLQAVGPTPAAATVLQRFGQLVEHGTAGLEA
ncbi:MAG: glutamine amidotransferase [Burkholderiaceae bacterium]|nr:glutamine amidotransferase [Burkholderiaceae bacterium]